jgi:hypothetical protein
VWLNLVPLLSLDWQFITVVRVAESLRNEFRDRRLRGGGDYGKGIGLAYPILGLLGIIPFVGVLFSLGSLGCFIMYWVKIAGLSGKLAAPPDDYDEDRDDEDDRPRRRSRRAEDDRPRRAKKRDDDWRAARLTASRSSRGWRTSRPGSL